MILPKNFLDTPSKKITGSFFNFKLSEYSAGRDVIKRDFIPLGIFIPGRDVIKPYI